MMEMNSEELHNSVGAGTQLPAGASVRSQSYRIMGHRAAQFLECDLAAELASNRAVMAGLLTYNGEYRHTCQVLSAGL